VLSIIQALDGTPGKYFASATHLLVKDREQLVITPKDLGVFGSYDINQEDSVFTAAGLNLQLRTLAAADYKIPKGRHIAVLDLNQLQFPLKIRPWKEGDWFVPLGMNGKKKISDFLINEKVPANLKPQIKVLTSDKSIVWIIGHRLDNRFKVTDKTENVLEIEVRNQ
jgi:tRNA(Ile)-lysidine synthase